MAVYPRRTCYRPLNFLINHHSIIYGTTLRWRHNGRDSVSNHHSYDCLLNRLFRRRSKKTSKLRVAGLCARNSPGTGEFPVQMASNAENASNWWRHHNLSSRWWYLRNSFVNSVSTQHSDMLLMYVGTVGVNLILCLLIHISNLMQIWCCSKLQNNHDIGSQFCICQDSLGHDSWAVATYASSWPGWIITSKQTFARWRLWPH